MGVIPAPSRHRSGSPHQSHNRIVGRQELDDLGAILDRTEPPQRDQFGSIAIALTMTVDTKSSAVRGRKYRNNFSDYFR